VELTEKSSTSTEPLEAIVEQLFTDMLLAYGKKFGDMWAGSTVDVLIDFWTRGLRGYTPREIRRGIEALETRPWPPTLPEFKGLCRPPVDGLVAYYEAVAGVAARAAGEFGKWSHPAVYWAAMPLAFDLGSQTYSQIKPRWERALVEQMDLGEWQEIPRPMLALALPGAAALSRENADRMLHQLKASTVAKKAVDKIDHKAWAKRILEREKRNDKTLTLIQVKFAREAMVIEA
jgi:hypothetical protein